MKGDYRRNRFTCEGCGAQAAGRPLPNGWNGYGTSAAGGSAYWCPTCIQNRTMANESRPSRAEAVDVARRRQQLLRRVR